MARIITVILVLGCSAIIFANNDHILTVLRGIIPKIEVPQKPATTENPTPQPAHEPVEEVKKPNPVTKSEVFRWVDDQGKVHYSDKSTNLAETPSEKIIVISETTEFTKTPYIKRVVEDPRQTSGQTSRSKRCKKMKARVAKDEDRLRRAGRVPSSSRNVSEKRWEIIKNC